MVRPCDCIGARFGDLVWMATSENHLFRVRERRLLAVRLIARSNHDALHEVIVDAARFQQIVGSANIGFESRQWEAVCRAHDGLRAQVKYSVDFTSVDGTLQRPEL